MHDTATLATLYSALIQANATILAILGAFLLTLAPFRYRWDSLRTDTERTLDQLERHVQDLEEVNQALGDKGRSEWFAEYLLQKRSREEALKHRDHLAQQSTELHTLVQRLLAESKEQIDQIKTRGQTSRDYAAGARMLLVFGFFGILIPAILLVLLPFDPAPFRRSFFALSAYALCLLGIVMLLMELDP